MHPTETNMIIYSAELNPLDCSKRFTPGRLVHSDTNPTSLRSIQLRCILRKDYLQTFPPLYIAIYSFMYMSELGHRGENENAQTLKQQQRGFETKLSQLRVQYSTAELLHSTTELLHSTAELLHSTDELLHSTAELLHSTAELLHSTGEPLRCASKQCGRGMTLTIKLFMQRFPTFFVHMNIYKLHVCTYIYNSHTHEKGRYFVLPD